MTSMNNWNIFVIRVDTFPDYRNVINNQGQRGSSDIDIGGGRLRRHMLLVSTPSNICQQYGYLYPLSPPPRFLDNRVVLLPIWKLPLAGAPVPAAISDKCYCLWDQGRAEGDFHCLSKAKRFVSQQNSWTKYEALGAPSTPHFRHDLRRRMSILKKCTVFLFVWIPYFVFYQVRLRPGSILMCL